MNVTRTIQKEPSNSKAPGAKRHLSLTLDSNPSYPIRFALGALDAPEGAIGTLRLGATYNIGQGMRARQERREATARIVVTGIETDVVALHISASQDYIVDVHGVRAA